MHKNNDKIKVKSAKPSFFGRISKALLGKSRIDSEFLDNLENILVESDVGVTTTLKIIGLLEQRAESDKFLNVNDLYSFLREEISNIFNASLAKESSSLFCGSFSVKPYVALFVGVNGVGKTTTVGKLAANLTFNSKKVFIGASDTFRAAAIEQLKEWGTRSNSTVIAQQIGADPSSVAFDTLQSALHNDADVVLIDTAGRLHNKSNLMAELSKIKTVISRLITEGPQETILVLDASTGQNCFAQCQRFLEATQITSIAVTKLDGTSKAGALIGIADIFKIPIKYVGLGENIQDIQPFSVDKYIKALFN